MWLFRPPDKGGGMLEDDCRPEAGRDHASISRGQEILTGNRRRQEICSPGAGYGDVDNGAFRRRGALMYRKKMGGWLKHLDFIILDLLCLQIAFALAYGVRMGPSNPYGDEEYRSIGIILLLADVAAVFLLDTFKNVLKRGYYKEFTATVRQVCVVEVVMITYLFNVQKSAAYSRFIIYLMAVLYLCTGYFVRLFWKALLLKHRVAAEKRSLLIVTEYAHAEEAIANVLGHEVAEFTVTGVAVMDRDMRGEKISDVPVVAGEKDVVDSVCHRWVDEALIWLPGDEAYPEQLAAQLAEMGVVVHIGIFRTGGSGGIRQFVGHLGDYTVLTASISYATPLQQFVKRGMDITGGILGCLITGILFLFLAPAIMIASPGPVFFSQERVGMNGKKFRIYKFRSMYTDAEERKKELIEKNRIGGGLMFKIEGDPRIIGCRIREDGSIKKGLGNFMRDHSLDEFPQFFNVLKGDMSLVGTRPPTLDEWERYEPHHRARLAVRPGITGLWQVSGRSRITDFEEVVKLDTKYITEWSMGMDLKILVKTVAAVFGRDGAM